MIDTIIDPNSMFLEEGKNRLIEEFGKEYGTYFSILALISDSKTSKSEIESILERNISGHLARLENDYNIIKSIKPINAKPNSKVQKYEIVDNFLAFWFRFIFKYQSLIEAENFDRLKEIGSNMIFADSTGLELSGERFLTLSILFKNLLKPQIKGQNIGLLLPSTAAGAFINYAVLMMGKTIINLNYTSELNSLKTAVQSAQIKTIIASKKFIEKLENRTIKGEVVIIVKERDDSIYVNDED